MNNLSISQNFLNDKNLVTNLLSLTNININDTILEIGPGKGIITIELSKICKNIIAIECDDKLYELLQSLNISNANIIYEDFLNYEFNSNVKIFSNIPFNITSNIFNKILDNYEYINDFYFIIQKEAAEMYMGINKETFKSLLFKPIYNSEIIYNFKKTDFEPSPDVNTVLVHFSKREYCDIKNAKISDYFDFIAYIFDNNETTVQGKLKKIITYEQLKRIKRLLKCSLNSKITDLCYQDILTLFNTYRDYVPAPKKNIVQGSYIMLKNKQEKLDKINKTRSKK